MQSIQEPISTNLASEQNGTITFFGMNPTGKGLSDIFSFVYYLPTGAKFFGSKYYYGLQSYIKMVHSPDFPFPSGVIVYTDSATKTLLEEVFPYSTYPNLILALVDWPIFSDEKGNVNNFVMRSLRYQATEHFSSLNVHIRDADTFFVTLIEDIRLDFIDFLLKWEAAYLQFLPKVAAKGKQIVMGSSKSYYSKFHSNIPYPVQFTIPFHTYVDHIFNRPLPDKKLYVKSKYLPYEADRVISEIYSSIYHGRGEKFKNFVASMPEGNQKTKYEGFIQELDKINPILRKYPPFNVEKKLEGRKSEIGKIVRNEFTEQKLAEGHFQPIPYFMQFQEKYMFNVDIAVFAGFVSVLKNREGIENFWSLCVEYLVKRYYMVPKPNGRRVASNELFLNSALAIGKDERMLLYGVIPKMLPKIFFLPVDYVTQRVYGRSHAFHSPSYFNSVNLNANTKPHSLFQSFASQTKDYMKWLSEFYERYPTEDAFLNAIDANIETGLIPMEGNAYKAYNAVGRKMTIRRKGGAQKRRFTKKRRV